MTTRVITPTPYPYVNEAVQMLLTNIQAVLNDYFVGLYLLGSLASGGFDPGHSDIDFLVVTTKALPKSLFPALEAMHMRIRDSSLEWAKKLEGTYLSRRVIHVFTPSKRKIPYLNEGRFFITEQGMEWIINRYILWENGITVAGPPIKSMIAPISRDELRKAIVDTLLTYWTPKVNERGWLEPPGHQPYIVLTCCRALYTLKHGIIASKSVSAEWALKALDKHWKGLIEHAINWHYGMPGGDIEGTLKMMRYTLKEAKNYQKLN